MRAHSVAGVGCHHQVPSTPLLVPVGCLWRSSLSVPNKLRAGTLAAASPLRTASAVVDSPNGSPSPAPVTPHTIPPQTHIGAAAVSQGAEQQHPVLGAIRHQANLIAPWLVDVRRELHRCPELKFEEELTSAAIRRHLEELGIPYTYPVAKTGIVAVIGSGSGPTCALRADMDALPIEELADVPFRSRTPGRMHACGHDSHMAMLLGAARILKAIERDLPGTVRLIFQPAEEGGGGGQVVVQEGALGDAAAAFGIHVWPTLPSGTVASCPGPIMAAVLSFEVRITGRGGHAAMPHLCVDPVVAGSAAVTALQTLIARETSPYDNAVVSVTRFRAGHAHNVIPDFAELAGTVRALRDEVALRLKARVGEVVRGVAATHGCSAEVSFLEESEPYFPPLVNDAGMYEHTKQVVGELLGGSHFREAEPTMAGEDFAFIAQAVPSCFAFLGTRNELVGAVHALHNPRFKLDEGVLPLGAALHASWAVRFLEKQVAEAQALADTP